MRINTCGKVNKLVVYEHMLYTLENGSEQNYQRVLLYIGLEHIISSDGFSPSILKRSKHNLYQ